MKRQLPSIILYIILFNLMGYYFIFNRPEITAKKYVCELSGESSSFIPPALLSFAIENEVAALKKTGESVNELRYEGSMYDVLKREKTADSHFLYCYKDESKTALITFFLEFVSQNTGNGGQEHSKFSVNRIAQINVGFPTQYTIDFHLAERLYSGFSTINRTILFASDYPPPDIVIKYVA